MRFVFFAYREWAIEIFRNISNPKYYAIHEDDEFILFKNSVDKSVIDALKPDVIFYYGWSSIIPQDIIDDHMCMCLHPSPLPSYRGGSPIQNQLRAGETLSSISLFRMDEGIDTGDVFKQWGISFDGYLDDIFKEIIQKGEWVTLDFIKAFKDGKVKFKPQSWYEEELGQKKSYFSRLKPEDSCITPDELKEVTAKYVYNIVRGNQPPYPEAYIPCGKGRLILEKVRYEDI